MASLAVETLEKLGFSNYEARAYIGLQQAHPVSGYQLSKNTGIPRSRIYGILDRLVAKGFATRYQTDPVVFVPLSPEALSAKLKAGLNQNLQTIRAYLRVISNQDNQEDILHLRGRQAILDWARIMLADARSTIFLSLKTVPVRTIEKELRAAANRGVRVISPSKSQKPAAAFNNTQAGQMIQIVVDRSQVLAGELVPGGSGQATWSRKPHMVSQAISAIELEVAQEKYLETFGADARQVWAEVRKAFSPQPAAPNPGNGEAGPQLPFWRAGPEFGPLLKQIPIEPLT